MNLEQVAYWYFRLNGCLTIPNFVVHPDRSGSQRTDADVLAVRFPHRCELLTSGQPMRDDNLFGVRGKMDVIIAEVKTGQCGLNGPWTRPGDENIRRVLYAIGLFPKECVPDVAASLYERHHWEDDQCYVRLFAVGRERSSELPETVTQVEWTEVLSFIHRRFRKYLRAKAQHEQWDETGQTLYDLAANHRESTEFVAAVLGMV